MIVVVHFHEDSSRTVEHNAVPRLPFQSFNKSTPLWSRSRSVRREKVARLFPLASEQRCRDRSCANATHAHPRSLSVACRRRSE